MDTKLLKQKILDLAIRGKLVPQNPADEPASVLLERIKAEKAQLIKEGKIKKEKPLPPIEEVPFEIPESWEWTTIGDFTGDLKYGTAEKSLIEGRVAVLRMGNITRDGSIDYSDLVYTNNESDIKKYLLKEGDILFNRTNSSEWVGKCAIYHEGIPAIYAGYIIRFTPIGLNPEYINYVMISGYERDYCAKVKTDGINQSNINSVKLAKFQVPVPPLAEQKRIVAEIDRWFKWIDELEKNQQDLHTAIRQAKSKILDLAIHGKLVPQDHYCKWNCSKIKELANIINGYAFKSSHYVNRGVRIIRIANVQDGYIEDKNPQYYPLNRVNEISDFILSEGDLLMSLTGNVGRVGILTKLFLPAALNQRVACIRTGKDVDEKFFFYYFQSDIFKKEAIENSKGVAQLNLSTEWLKNYTIHYPKIEEQKRIVTKIEELFAQLDKIEECIN